MAIPKIYSSCYDMILDFVVSYIWFCGSLPDPFLYNYRNIYSNSLWNHILPPNFLITLWHVNEFLLGIITKNNNENTAYKLLKSVKYATKFTHKSKNIMSY